MKVAITHPYSWPDVRRGAERITMETARALANRGHEVTLFSAGNPVGREGHDGFTVVRYRRAFTKAALHERWFGWRVLPDLVRGRFDAVHSLMPCDGLAAIRARRFTRNVTVYDEMGVPYREFWAGMRDGRIRRRVARDADVYGCMSRFALDVFESNWGRSGVVIPGGVRLSQFVPAEERESEPTILFSAALDVPHKRLDLLLEALALVADRVPDVRLWLSGPGDPSAILAGAPVAARERTRHLPLGEPEEQGRRYARAWVTVLPSDSDSFGLVTLESLAAGTPIVVTDKGAPPELVRPGVGFVGHAGDAVSLAGALVDGFELARDPKTVASCRARAAEFDWDEAIAPLLEPLYAARFTAAASGDATTRAT